MGDFQTVLARVPVFVWPVLAFVVWRAMRYARARVATLRSVAAAPTIIGLLSLGFTLLRIGTTISAPLVWVACYAIGCALGWLSVHRQTIAADHANRRLTLPADWSFPPLLLLFFGVRFWVGWRVATQPGIERHLAFALTEIAISASIAGIFGGKAWTLWRKYEAARDTKLPEAGPV